MRTFWIFFVVFCVIALLPEPVFANFDPCEGLYWYGEVNSLEQAGQDVQIHLELRPPFDMLDCSNSYGAPLNLWRINKLENKKLLDINPHLDDMTPFAPSPSGDCMGPACGDDTYDGEGCEDCDGDGIAECPRGGCSAYVAEFTDTCAPPGPTQYDLSTYGVTNIDVEHEEYIYNYVCMDRGSIEIVESGAVCPLWNNERPDKTDPCKYPPADDVQPDDDNDTQTDDDQIDDSTDDTHADSDDQADDDNDDGESGCGGCNTSGAEHQAPLASGMWVIGLASFILFRRRG